MKRIIIGVCMLSVMLTGIVQAKTYKVGMVPWAGFSPANVADVKEFWKASGLDVTVFMMNNNGDVHKALVAKRIDIAIDIEGFWVDHYMKGVPVTIISEIDWSNGGDKILLKKGVTPDALKGQMIGTYDDSSATLVLLARYLKDQGLRVADVQRVVLAIEKLPEKLRTLNLSAVICYDPVALEIEKSGDGVLAASSADYPGSIADSIAMRTDVLHTAPREEIVKFLRGWIEAVKWIQEESHWTEYAQILNQQTFKGSEPLAEDELRQIVAGVRILDPQMLLQQHQPDGGIFRSLQELHDILADNQMLKKDFTPQDLVDNSFILEALQAQP